jgi:hypothetical protein
VKPLAKVKPTTIGELVDRVMELGARVRNDAREQTLLELDAEAAADTDPRRPGVFAPGDRVVFTARFLYMTHAYRDISTVFTIQACACALCAFGEHVCTTEWLAGYDTFRHVHRSAIRHHGALHADDLPPTATPISIPRAANQRWLNRDDRARVDRAKRGR